MDQIKFSNLEKNLADSYLEVFDISRILSHFTLHLIVELRGHKPQLRYSTSPTGEREKNLGRYLMKM